MAVDQDKELDLEDLDLDLEEAGSEQSRGRVLSEDDLEQYGVWIKVKPHTVDEGAARAEQEPRLESLEQQAASSQDTALTEEEEELLGSLEERSFAEPVEVDEVSELSLPAEEELGALEPEGEQVDLPLSEEPARGERFAELSSLEEELNAGKPAGAAGAVPRSQVLAKIEEELAAIRGELAALKGELVSLRKPGGGGAAKPAEGEREAGFFADDSDETIALTGDELDNILNTAEITEEEATETAAGEELADLAVPAEPEAGGEEISLEPVAEALAGEAAAVEAIPLDEPIEEALEEAPAFDTQAISLEIPEEEPSLAESVDLELPDIEEIGLDALEEKPEALEEAAAEPIEDLEIELTDEAAQEGQKGAPIAEAVGEAALEEEALELPALEEELEPSGEEELVLDVPEEVSADLEPLEAVEAEAAEPGTAEALEEEISLELPELGVPVEEAAAAPEDLSLEIPEEEIAEAAGMAAGAPSAVEAAESVEPLEEIEEIEEIEAAEERPEPATRAAAAAQAVGPARQAPAGAHGAIPSGLRDEIRTVLKYMDQLLEALPDDKIKEFADSEYFEVYKRLFDELEIA